MSKRGWVVVIIGGSVLLLLASFLAGGVYSTVDLGGGKAYLVNRFTGKTVDLRPSVPEPQKLAALPAAEMAKLEGRASLQDNRDVGLGGGFRGDMYNGSSWTIQEITVSVSGMSVDGTEVRDKMYRIYCHVDPLARGTFYTTMEVVPSLDTGFAWSLVSARGTPGG